MERVIEFWECDRDAERLRHTDKDEAIEDFLDYVEPEKWTGKLTVYGYARMEVDQSHVRLYRLYPLEYLLDRLEEEYGDPDGDHQDGPTEAMIEAERKFLEVVLREYKPWACEEVTSEEVDVQAWVREHRPDWLDEIARQQTSEGEDEECQT